MSRTTCGSPSTPRRVLGSGTPSPPRRRASSWRRHDQRFDSLPCSPAPQCPPLCCHLSCLFGARQEVSASPESHVPHPPQRADLLGRAELRICAFDIECTKLPLQAPTHLPFPPPPVSSQAYCFASRAHQFACLNILPPPFVAPCDGPHPASRITGRNHDPIGPSPRAVSKRCS